MVRVCVIAIFFWPIVAASQDKAGGKLHSYFTLYCQTQGALAPSYEPFQSFVDKMALRYRASKNDRAFVHHLFVKAHQRFFRTFREYSSFSDLVSKGEYNCLSGTALFTLLLDHFTIDHQVIETNHHTYVLVSTSDGPVLLETTDGGKGFVTEAKAISRKVLAYQNARQDGGREPDLYRFEYTKAYSDTVTLTGILGLLHYNHSVEALNKRDYKTAIAHLHHALLLHRSEKLEAFLTVLYNAVSFDESIPPERRRYYQEKLRILQTKKRAKNAGASMIP